MLLAPTSTPSTRLTPTGLPTYSPTTASLMADEFSTLGREAIRHALADMFQAMKVTAELQIDRIREEGDMAIALTSSTGSLIVLPTNTTNPANHRELFVLHKSKNDWLTAYYMFNDSVNKPT
jgi:ketosteroid isomerase-like protein